MKIKTKLAMALLSFLFVVEASAFCAPEWIPFVGGMCFFEKNKEIESNELWQAESIPSAPNELKVRGSCKRADYNQDCGAAACVSPGKIECDGTCVGATVIVPTSWEPNVDPDTVCTTATLIETSNCGTTRTVPGTKCCVTSWTPATNTVCNGTSFTQTSNCSTTRSATGTKTDGVCCIVASWTPATNTVCNGTSFTQTSNCSTTRSATGTKTDGICCVDSLWLPLRLTVCLGKLFQQTSNCGTTRYNIGIKTGGECCVESSWTPATSTVCTGTSFTQISNCGTTRPATGTKYCTCNPSCGAGYECVNLGRGDYQCFPIYQGTCFVRGTQITMADGSLKNIERVEIGEEVKGADGNINKVVKHDVAFIEERSTYIINGEIEFTGDHPFLSTDGWKVGDVELFHSRERDLKEEVTALAVGDILIAEDGYTKILTLEQSWLRPSSEIVFNLLLDGNSTYIANGFYVHNGCK